MSKIRQGDIYAGSISFTKAANFSVTIGVSYAQSNLTATAYSLGTVSGMATTDPIAIKDFGTSSITSWADEQDWTVYNKSFTTTIPASNVAGGVVVYTTSTNASISIGDLVGIYGPGSWATTGSLTIAKKSLTALGSQAAAMVAGGFTSAATNATEIFNGSSWFLGPTLSTVRQILASAGSQNAGLVTGGFAAANVTTTELYNGSVWSAGAFLSTAKSDIRGLGSQSAALVAGGNTSAVTNVTELFNGTVWSVSASGNLSEAKKQQGTAGAQYAGLSIGGANTTQLSTTEMFNGSSWSLSGLLSQGTQLGSGAGSQSAAFITGGNVTGGTKSSKTELFNGSSWSSSSVMSAAKQDLGSAGSQSLGIATGGDTGSSSAVVELHNQTLYRKIVSINELKSAQSVGVAFDVTSTTLSVKFNGFVNNINITSSNSGITTAAQWANNWVVLSRFNPNTSTTSNPPSVIVKSSIEAEDFLVGWAISQTQMQVFAGNIFNRDRIGGW